MPQDLICSPTMTPEDVITLEKGAEQETQKHNKEEDGKRSDSEVSIKDDDKVTQNKEDNEETSQDDNTTKPGTNYHQIYLKSSQQRCEIEPKQQLHKRNKLMM